MKLNQTFQWMFGWGGFVRWRRRILMALVSHYKWHPSTKIATFPENFLVRSWNWTLMVHTQCLSWIHPDWVQLSHGALISPFICHLEALLHMCLCVCVCVSGLLPLLQMASNSIFRRGFDRVQADGLLAWVAMSHILVGVMKGEQPSHPPPPPPTYPAHTPLPKSPHRLILFKFKCTAVYTSCFLTLLTLLLIFASLL